jgi:hypothetical protein
MTVLSSEFQAGYRPTPEQAGLINDLLGSYERRDLCEALDSG